MKLVALLMTSTLIVASCATGLDSVPGGVTSGTGTGAGPGGAGGAGGEGSSSSAVSSTSGASSTSGVSSSSAAEAASSSAEAASSSASSGAGGAGGGPTGLSVQYKVEISGASTTAIGAQLFIVNNSMSAVDLNDLTVRYYLTNEVAAALMYSINWANIGAINGPSAGFATNQMSIVAVPMAMPVASADTYVEIGFNAGNDDLPAGHRLHFSFTMQNFASQNFMQTGDYSFNAGANAPMDSQSVVLMYQGQSVVWGVEP